MRARTAQIIIVAVAITAALIPLPSSLVEDYYSAAIYPALQVWLTSASNAVGIAVFDLVVSVMVLIAGGSLARGIVGLIRDRSSRRLLHAGGVIVTTGAVAYLWFLGAWGLNYARHPLEHAIGFDATRVTPAAVRALAERATLEVNRGHAPAHESGFPARNEVPSHLVTAFQAVEKRLGRQRATVPSRPKPTVMAIFFRSAGVDGMHAPFFLETLLNPDLTPPERPAVLAHEWAHLAGYAPEDDASFVGTIAALRGDAGSRYSGWLALFHDTVGQLPAVEQRELLDRLGDGPRADRRAIFARLEARVEVVARASWETYDQYLKAQGVKEGVRSYSRVVQLIVGSGAIDWP